jgi:hypothetical protein
MNNKWNDRELYLLSHLRAYCQTKQLKDIFCKLGFERSSDAITHQSKNLGLVYEGESILP